MAETVRQTEAIPATYPAIAESKIKAVGDDANWVWQRIEGHIAHRFTVRECVWIVEGAGDWVAPLTPATITNVEQWSDGSWISYTAGASPYGGLCFSATGPYRITATVGGGSVPAAVSQAAFRLAEYVLHEVDAERGPQIWAQSQTVTPEQTVQGLTPGSETFQRPSSWLSDALRKSGAADLLRNYRRA